MPTFREHLQEQRWDDHRYYHHSLINQSLHLVSAITFCVCYLLLFSDPALASLLAWGVAMTSRQAGHFFFEPKDYDVVNRATHAHKEAIKIGYNLARKWVLMSLWAACPLALAISPTLWGLFDRPAGVIDFCRHVGLMWLALGVAAIAFRSMQLSVTRDVQTGLVWATKIVTDPLNDIRLYHKAPAQLARKIAEAKAAA